MNRIRKEVFISLLCAISVIVNIVEGLYFNFLPYGLKIGLANIFALIVIRKYGAGEMIILNVLRLFLSSLLKGSLFSVSFFIAAGGMCLSSIAMILLNKKATLSFTSLVSAVFHNIGQLIVVMYVYASAEILVLGPVLILMAVPCGLLTSFIASKALERLESI
ncbi:MAG: Gx transporter family protein [Erysipelotrichaceae bacterium]|nr:Gx transporter family protein [Erysipelotrichaceae bacterium]